MTAGHERGKDDARYRDAGIAEALLKLGSDVATTHPGVLTHCDGVWVHHVCDGRDVEVRVVSGSELAALRERIALFQAPFSLAGSAGEDGSGEAVEGLVRSSVSESLDRDFGRVAGELTRARRDFDAIEMQLRENALAGSAALYRTLLEGKDAELPAPECPKCGRMMKRRRQKVPKTFLTRVGEVTLGMTYHYCRRCGESKVPLDDYLGLEGTSMSPGVERMIAELAVEVPNRKSAHLLNELSRISVGCSRLWSKVVEPGGDAVRFEREDVATVGEVPNRIHVSIDGTGIPMRKEVLEGRAGEQDDGGSKTRDAKFLRFYEMEPDPKTGKAATVQGSITQLPAIDSAAAPECGMSAFEARLGREALRRGAHDAREIVIVSDASAWIENTADKVFGSGEVTWILDRFHALEYLHDAVRAIETDPVAEERLYERLKALLKAGKVEPVIRELLPYAALHDAVAKCVGYFRNNLHKMRYDEYRAKSMPVGLGVIEGGCKSVICGRMKKSGARWSLTGANNIMALRCCSTWTRCMCLFRRGPTSSASQGKTFALKSFPDVGIRLSRNHRVRPH
ncbi:MAG: ISKra4 family transposase [Rhodobacteraceae bacterium]|nr:ISKra4 family transposase [Paracoccaceae bacterium]MCY4137230.1 ISKra4 family transposase [Paracoccaceae bacterium]